MIDELTPEQRFELFEYASIEPFGEVRSDLRMGKLLQFYYDSKRGKRGRAFTVEEFTLYPDLIEAGRGDPASESALLRALGE